VKPLPHLEENLFSAAVDAIRVGIEDIDHPERARKVAAIRNFYAGVLLLCKHRLMQHSPPENPFVLIAAKTKLKKNPAGQIEPVPVGSQTIGANELIQRLEEFETGLDTSRLKDLQTHRNDIEHYFTSATDQKLQEVFVEVQLLVNDLIARSGRANPLGPAWVKLVEKSDAFVARRERSRRDLARVTWRSAIVEEAISDLRYAELCECGSSHIVRVDSANRDQDEIVLRCLACNADVPTESFVESLLEGTFGLEDWEAAKEGEPFAVYECPQCQVEAYVRQEDQCGQPHLSGPV